MDVRGCRRFTTVGSERLSEVLKCWRCAVVGGARCGWGSVGGVVGDRWTWTVSPLVVGGGSAGGARWSLVVRGGIVFSRFLEVSFIHRFGIWRIKYENEMWREGICNLFYLC